MVYIKKHDLLYKNVFLFYYLFIGEPTNYTEYHHHHHHPNNSSSKNIINNNNAWRKHLSEKTRTWNDWDSSGYFELKITILEQ